MNRKRITAITALAAALGLTAMTQSTARSPSKRTIRIGTYDTRAIAIAWAGSKYNPVKAKLADLEVAKKAGDHQRIKELEAWGPVHQRLLHFQGFGRVPVGDMLAPVKQEIAQLSRDRGLAAIAMECDYTAPNVEVVDVSEALAELYVPSSKARQIVRSLRNVKPLGLLEVADMKEND